MSFREIPGLPAMEAWVDSVTDPIIIRWRTMSPPPPLKIFPAMLLLCATRRTCVQFSTQCLHCALEELLLWGEEGGENRIITIRPAGPNLQRLEVHREDNQRIWTRDQGVTLRKTEWMPSQGAHRVRGSLLYSKSTWFASRGIRIRIYSKITLPKY